MNQMKIAIFYHCLFALGTPDNLLENAISIVREQVGSMKDSGVINAASEFHVGLNGGSESATLASLIFPQNTRIVLHGLQCRNECRTILMLEDWIPEHRDWLVLYLHSKGSTHQAGDGFNTRWRKCMMKGVVNNWRTCVADLGAGFEAVGSHWMEPPATPAGQFIFAGNFWWARAEFLATLPSIRTRSRITISGIDSIDSRYESEVWLGNGSRRPKIKDYHGPDWNPSKIGTCTE